MLNTQFRVNRHCTGVDQMQTLCQTSFQSFHNSDFGILCQWPVWKFASSPMIVMNASHYSIRNQQQAECKIWNFYSNTWKKNYSSSETAFKYHNHNFQILFHDISGRWTEDPGAVREFAIDGNFIFGPWVRLRKNCNLKRRQLFAMATGFRTCCCLDKEALLGKYVATNKGNNFCHQLIFYQLISDLRSSCLWNAGLNHFLSRFKM